MIDRKKLLNEIIDQTILFELKWDLYEKTEDSETFQTKIEITNKKFMLLLIHRKDSEHWSPNFYMDVYFTTTQKPNAFLLKRNPPNGLHYKYVTGVYKSSNPDVFYLYAIVKYYNYLGHNEPDYPSKLLKWSKMGLITWYQKDDYFICYDVVKTKKTLDKIDRDLFIEVKPYGVIIKLGDEVISNIDDSKSTPILYNLLKKEFEGGIKENFEWDDEEYDLDDIKRCGVCGTIIDKKGNPILDMDILSSLTDEQIDNLELDWCYDCAMEQSMTNYPSYVSRDMAIDAGHPEWEGMPY
jgi:hypothetical protein